MAGEGRAVQMAAGAEEAFASLVAARSEFLGFVARRVGDAATAEDLLQQAYARAVERIGALEEVASARAWFYRILRNLVVDLYRRRAVETRVLGPMPEGFDAAEPSQVQPNLCRCMERAIDGLKPEYASVLREVELAEGEGATLAAYAQRQGITAGNAAVRALRARRAMEQSLRQVCGSCAGAGCLDCSCRHHDATGV